MTDPMTWQAVVSKLIDNLPAILTALAACMAYLQSRRNGIQQTAVAADVTAVVTQRSDSQDHQLTKIEQATNGGVQALRDEVSSLKALLATAVEDLHTARAKP